MPDFESGAFNRALPPLRVFCLLRQGGEASAGSPASGKAQSASRRNLPSFLEQDTTSTAWHFEQLMGGCPSREYRISERRVEYASPGVSPAVSLGEFRQFREEPSDGRGQIRHRRIARVRVHGSLRAPGTKGTEDERWQVGGLAAGAAGFLARSSLAEAEHLVFTPQFQILPLHAKHAVLGFYDKIASHSIAGLRGARFKGYKAGY
jgi:hypothetical protein